MTEAMPFLQKTILLSYDPRSFRRGFFLQYRQTALSDLRWNGHDQPRRPIFAGCGNSLPGLPGFQVRQSGGIHSPGQE